MSMSMTQTTTARGAETTMVPGGYTIEHLMPGFRVNRGRKVLGQVGGWREAVATVLVDKEERRAVRS